MEKMRKFNNDFMISQCFDVFFETAGKFDNHPPKLRPRIVSTCVSFPTCTGSLATRVVSPSKLSSSGSRMNSTATRHWRVPMLHRVVCGHHRTTRNNASTSTTQLEEFESTIVQLTTEAFVAFGAVQADCACVD